MSQEWMEVGAQTLKYGGQSVILGLHMTPLQGCFMVLSPSLASFFQGNKQSDNHHPKKHALYLLNRSYTHLYYLTQENVNSSKPMWISRHFQFCFQGRLFEGIFFLPSQCTFPQKLQLGKQFPLVPNTDGHSCFETALYTEIKLPSQPE